MTMFSKVASIAILCWLSPVAAADDILSGLSTCEEIKDSNERLKCYDNFVLQLREQEVGKLMRQSQPQLLAQPAAKILNSSLQTPDSNGQLNLRVRDLIKMIKEAKLDEGGGIEILGWQKLDENNYIMWLNLRGRTGLTIQYYEKFKHLKSVVSVLEAVVMKGRQVDPGMFIMNIAAMGPE